MRLFAAACGADFWIPVPSTPRYRTVYTKISMRRRWRSDVVGAQRAALCRAWRVWLGAVSRCRARGWAVVMLVGRSVRRRDRCSDGPVHGPEIENGLWASLVGAWTGESQACDRLDALKLQITTEMIERGAESPLNSRSWVCLGTQIPFAKGATTLCLRYGRSRQIRSIWTDGIWSAGRAQSQGQNAVRCVACCDSALCLRVTGLPSLGCGEDRSGQR